MDLSLSEVICHTEFDTVWGPDAVAGVGGPGLSMTQLHTLKGTTVFWEIPHHLLLEGRQLNHLSFLCSTLDFSSLLTDVSFVAIWSWTWWVLLSKILAPWKEAKNKLIIEYNVFFLVCGHCWFYLKKSLPGLAISSLIEAIVGLDQRNFNHAYWSDSAHTGLPRISLWFSPFPVKC